MAFLAIKVATLLAKPKVGPRGFVLGKMTLTIANVLQRNAA